MELTPRTGPDAGGPDQTTDTAPSAPGRGRSRWPALALLVVVVLVGGWVLLNALGGATTFFRNADEAVAQRDALGTSRFRLQGTVEQDSIVQTADGVSFVVTYNGAEVPVVHQGDPPQMFKENEAVVLEGAFADGSDTYRSDLIIVKHSNVYEAENQGRLKEAEKGGQVPPGTSEGSPEASTP
jgi:cytochrome c-type biogenesis protein CcmE